VTTHQIDELQDVLTDVVFLDRGRIVLACDMGAYESRFFELMVRPDRVEAARALGPIHERQTLGRTILLFDGAERARLEALGEVRRPSIAELFVGVMTAAQEVKR
jgi:ABC-2 type transport system ATP-binding protein